MQILLIDELELVIISLISINNKFSVRLVEKEDNSMSVLRDFNEKDKAIEFYYSELAKLNVNYAN